MGSTIKTNDGELQVIFDHFRQSRPENTLSEYLGLDIDSTGTDTVYVTFEMRDHLIGNPVFRSLNGGIISGVFDILGGQVAFLEVFRKVKGAPLEKQIKHFSKVATIDLRVDYLQPGKGEKFTAKGWTLRSGNKVAVVRMELHNQDSVLIAVATGTYLMG